MDTKFWWGSLYYIKIDLKDIGGRKLEIYCVEQKQVVGFCESGNEFSCSINGHKYLDLPMNLWLPQKGLSCMGLVNLIDVFHFVLSKKSSSHHSATPVMKHITQY